jgi:NitT/TauT family transport system substrate-binding protein
MVDSLREGWTKYLDDPKPANAAMGKLNQDMDAATFAAAAEAEKPLIEPVRPQRGPAAPVGDMSIWRWQQLIDQLVDLNADDGSVAAHPPKAADCFLSTKENK